MCIQLLRLGLPSPHREARLRRRELRQREQGGHKEVEQRMKQLQVANESKQRQLEVMKKVLSNRHTAFHSRTKFVLDA